MNFMRKYFHLLSLALALLITFSACNRLPDHAKYIPKDALVVLGVNTGKIGKEIAWSAIVGSKLFDEMKKAMPQKGAMEGLGNAGIKHTSTSYLYIKSNKAQSEEVRIIALVPLDDAAKWENYVKKTFPNANIKTIGDRKEANLVNGMYAGWTKDLLVIMNLVKNKEPDIASEVETDTTNSISPDSASIAALEDTTHADTLAAMPAADTASRFVADENRLAAEMQSAFTVENGNEITTDERFKKMEVDGHDFTIWVNYDVLMSQNSDKMGMPQELALGNTLWKDAAFSGGFDFEKGKIAGKMLYYTSEGLRDISKDLGSTVASKDLLDRLPAQNLDMLAGLHLSMKGLKGILEKTGMLGFANLALNSEGLSTDDILEAFSGDMGMSINDFKVQYEKQQFASLDSTSISYNTTTTNMNFLYAMKVGNKDKLNKLLTYSVSKEMLQSMGNNIYKAPASDSVFIVVNDNFLVAANRLDHAQAFLSGSLKNQPLPTVAKKEVYDHPLGVYINFQNILNAVQASQHGDYSDSVIIGASRNLFDNVVFNGGEYKENAFHYHFALNLMNKNENSFFQIMNFALKVSDAMDKEKVSRPAPSVVAR